MPGNMAMNWPDSWIIRFNLKNDGREWTNNLRITSEWIGRISDLSVPLGAGDVGEDLECMSYK